MKASAVECLDCGIELVHTNASDEHVIPNAIGGRLKSSGVLCVACNSMHADRDAVFCNHFAYLVKTFDLPRDRGGQKALLLLDDVNNLEFSLRAGFRPALKPNFKKEGDKITFFAADETSARLVFKEVNPRKKLKLEPQGTRVELEAPVFQLQIPLSDIDFKRSIAKIACSFLRRCGIKFSSKDPLARFAYGERLADRTIFAVRGDVIPPTATTTRPMRHVLAVHRFRSGAIFVYVALFEFIEFLVRLDGSRTHFERTDVYTMDLVSSTRGWTADRWAPLEEELASWSEASDPNLDRSVARASVVSHYNENLDELWVSRAREVLMEAFREELEKGTSSEKASQIATANANKYLEKYDLSISDFSYAKLQ